MSSPFDEGRDSATGENDFGQLEDVRDEHVAAVAEFAKYASSNRLNEQDYL